MDDAEDFIRNDELAKSSAYVKMKLSTKQSDQSPFNLMDKHRSVLWLLDEYVLSIKTFSDFGTSYLCTWQGRPRICCKVMLAHLVPTFVEGN